MSIQLDDIDIKILNHLQQNARLNHKELGDRLHKAPTTIYTRITKLEKAGLIKGYVALLNQKKIHMGQTVYTHVQLKNHSEETMQQFENAINNMPEVMECYHLTGDYDFLLRIVVKDIETYHQFLVNNLFRIGLVAKMDSAVVMRESKRVTAFELRPDQFIQD